MKKKFHIFSYSSIKNRNIRTESIINFAHGVGTCLLLAEGNTPINCSNGRNYNKISHIRV